MNPTATRYVHVYMEANPNPASMKFVTNFILVPDGVDYHFENIGDASISPLAQLLFGFDFVDKVFIMTNFVTVTKKAEYEWGEIGKIIREEISEFLRQDRPVFEKSALQTAAFPESVENQAELSEVIRKVKEILDEYIRPAVESDGGAINFHSFDEPTGTVKVQLRGSCSGCPSSTVTLKAGIENLLRRMVPEVKEVVAEGV